jgi:hypothetical protein
LGSKEERQRMGKIWSKRSLFQKGWLHIRKLLVKRDNKQSEECGERGRDGGLYQMMNKVGIDE